MASTCTRLRSTRSRSTCNNRGRSTLCRYGTFWSISHPVLLVRSSIPVLDLELFRSGSARSFQPHCQRGSVFSSCPSSPPCSTGSFGHHCDRHCLPVCPCAYLLHLSPIASL